MDTLSLTGKVAIITGSGRETGIGAGIAAALARNGAWVVINHVSDTTAPRAAKVAESLNQNTSGKAVVVQADVSSAEGAKMLVNETLRLFGVDHVDILVNNAATGSLEPFLNVSSSSMESTFRSIVFAPVYMIQSVIPHMPRGGRIINIGSVASKICPSPIAIYAGAKAAADAMTFAMSMELGRGYGVTINTVMPGGVATDAFPKEIMEKMHEPLIAMTRAEERIGTTEDIGDAVLLLCNEKSRWITGQVISVSGGVTGG
ncbi:short-chain dehydrogenase, putative [Talaromyces stipitatus ATCC 10500]|uniref:Short-chain dehydrogenase, putative n=1 Tax=Talaromyces stipitatus (strain ATCC 10500 / CBS 375.48 / QM 6759 / NRRL 1006) TaxID=441959 RepID=B8MHD2_TALSN|nr:short-chain dehydrogenase, putative [Talaromyces stipitatus ATCC 10500]EED17111.1 short-chain dehydrogenase, putative [Talaromyces stipitatus ATCC 10500]